MNSPAPIPHLRSAAILVISPIVGEAYRCTCGYVSFDADDWHWRDPSTITGAEIAARFGEYCPTPDFLMTSTQRAEWQEALLARDAQVRREPFAVHVTFTDGAGEAYTVKSIFFPHNADAVLRIMVDLQELGASGVSTWTCVATDRGGAVVRTCALDDAGLEHLLTRYPGNFFAPPWLPPQPLPQRKGGFGKGTSPSLEALVRDWGKGGAPKTPFVATAGLRPPRVPARIVIRGGTKKRK